VNEGGISEQSIAPIRLRDEQETNGMKKLEK
jgi:hypothetical protein